jgi:hypothetical protein
MTEFYWNGREVSEAEFLSLADASQEAFVLDAKELVESIGVSRETADAILYLRGRSRWTQEKEDELISRDKAGNPISINVILRGEF